jgi:bifunctional non-homologous end joining protein LigD
MFCNELVFMQFNLFSDKKYQAGPVSSFVIHEHNARHLHYDFRLEINGVLKSWVLPKKPLLKAGQKRLAIQVADHAIEYKNFEGKIPVGNYGAGAMSIWDQGIFIPLLHKKSNSENFESDKTWKESLSELGNGIFNFYLKGEKLKGKFTLIRMKNQIKNWLFVRQSERIRLRSFHQHKKVLNHIE